MAAITRVYDTYEHARRVVNDLEASGVAASDISLVANKHVSAQYENVDEVSAAGSGASVGAALGGGAGLLAGLGLLAIPGLGPVVAVGWLATTALGAAAGAATGGLIGALMGEGVDEADAHVYAESLRRGGTMVTVRTTDTNRAKVESVMNRHSPIDPSVRGDEYRSGGWKTFDPDAPAYKPSQAEIERIRRS